MKFNTQEELQQQRKKIRTLIENEFAPYAQAFDQQQWIPRSYILLMAENGFLGANVQKKYGGSEWTSDAIRILHEELGRCSCSLENLVTVFGMSTKAIQYFGSAEQKQSWLKKIIFGELIVSVAFTEPDIGSDLQQIKTTITEEAQYYRMNGSKKYITLGQIADLFLVLAQLDGQHTVILVEKQTKGLEIKPIKDCLGFRANMLAEIHFDNCMIPKVNQIGLVGAGLTQVCQIALDEARFTTSSGCVGLGQACLDAVFQYVNKRHQGGVLLKDHQLIQKMLTEMIVELHGSRSLCKEVAQARDSGRYESVEYALIAKYAASKMAIKLANCAMQIFAAAGLTRDYPIERYYRDAKVMEIIEGTSQMYEINIPKAYSNAENILW